MQKTNFLFFSLLFMVIIGFTKCTGDAKTDIKVDQLANGGFENQVKFGEHLVLIAGCHDCHTPKKMTAMGPEPDFDLQLSGHPAEKPKIDVNKKEMQQKGLVVTDGNLTEWIGPWGVSYTANLTPDETGIGNWKEEQFFLALREGKFKGLAGGRSLLPPMPWQMIKNMTDDEIKAIFSYLKTIKPINNLVPPPLPPEGK